MITLAGASRWFLAVLALAWSAFTGVLVSLAIAVKTHPGLTAADIADGPDSHPEETLRFVHAYPSWELGALIAAALVMTAGAVQLTRRRAAAWPLLALSVGIASLLAVYDRRLPDPGFNRPLDSNAIVVFWLLCLAPAWWLSRRAPDLRTAA